MIVTITPFIEQPNSLGVSFSTFQFHISKLSYVRSDSGSRGDEFYCGLNGREYAISRADAEMLKAAQ